jgi:hypothetical protein
LEQKMLTPESITDTPEAREERRREADLRYRRHVQDLLGRRSDLQGVSRLADLIADATRWAA